MGEIDVRGTREKNISWLKVQKERDQAQTLLDEILAKLGKYVYFYPWVADRSWPWVVVSRITWETWAAIDLAHEPVTMNLLCDRLIQTHEGAIHLLQCIIDRLREIRDG